MDRTPAWWRRPGDATAVALLVALPVLVFGLPALFGHAVLPGDDMTQNFPLRVLAGREIRSGHLPLFDPYAWSGSPLLAGWNAGAAYPLTWLFAVLPAVAAWTAGLIVTAATAGVGLFAFLRALRLGPVPALLGAVSFALAGAMSAQVTHFGLVAGMSWVPLALLAVLRLSGSSRTDEAASPVSGRLAPSWHGAPRPGAPRPGVPRRQLRWAAVLALAVGLIILAGEPRAIVDGFVIVGIYAVWQVGRLRLSGGSWRRALPGALLIAGGCVLGVCLGAVQWLPGLAAVSTSQRGSGSMALFSSGSLSPRWLVLTLVPDLLGGSGSFSQPAFFASYNLTEVTSYVGILPLVAAFALLGRAFTARSGVTRRVPEWLVWHVQAAVGIVLALGGNTPLGTVLYHLPLFGGQRLQSRNILVLDLALAILLAYWLDKPFPALARAGAGRLSRLRAPSPETLAGLLPPLAILALVILSLTQGAGLLRWLGAPAVTSAREIGRLLPWLLPYAVLAAAAIGLMLFGRRLGRRGWARTCSAFVFTDVVVFTVLGVVKVASPGPSVAPSPSVAHKAATAAVSASSTPASSTPASSRPASAAAATAAATTAARPVSALGYQGRFAIYDPGLQDGRDLSVIGPPDINGMSASGMPSVQGYSSIVDGTYASATGSHEATGDGQNVLSPAAIGNGTLDALETSILLTLPEYLTTSLPSHGGPAASTGTSGSGQRKLVAGQDATWYLGQSVTVSRVVVPDDDARADAAAGAEIGLMTPDGLNRWFRARAASGSALQAELPQPMTATAVLARAGGTGTTRGSGRAGGTSHTFGAPQVGLADGHVLAANGRLQNVLAPPRWGMAGFDGGFAVFNDKFAAGPLTVEPLTGRPGSSGRYTRTASESALDASVRAVLGQSGTSMSGDVTAASVSSTRGVRLVRSVAAIPGWSATWQPKNGQPVTLSVQRDGIVQAVDVPAGQGTVTWHYTPPRLAAGLGLSATAALLTLVLTVVGRRPCRAVRSAPQCEPEPQAA